MGRSLHTPAPMCLVLLVVTLMVILTPEDRRSDTHGGRRAIYLQEEDDTEGTPNSSPPPPTRDAGEQQPKQPKQEENVAPRAPSDGADPATPAPPAPAPKSADSDSQRSLAGPLEESDEERQWREEYHAKFQKFGVKRRTEFLKWFASTGKEVPPWKPGRAAPIVCNGREIYTAYFSIPEAQMTTSYPKKTKDWSHVVPGLRKTYIFKPTQEAAYVADMQASRFAITYRKGGWQSARTYEILGAAAIPYFCDLWDSPKRGTVANMPRELLVAALQFEGLSVKCFPKKQLVRVIDSSFNYTLFDAIAEKLRVYSARYLTTAHTARYMLSSLNLDVVPKKVLVVWTTHPIHPGYTMPTFMMGMKELGVSVVDYPRQDIIYEDPHGTWGCKQKAAKSWGRGFFSFCRVKESEYEANERKRIAEALAAKEYDAVIFHVPHESYLYFEDGKGAPRLHTFPFFNETVSRYPKDRVMMLHDGDMLYETNKDTGYELFKPYGRYVRRETHGCNEDIWATRSHKQLLLPSAGVPADDEL